VTCEIYKNDGVEYCESDGGRYALGLNPETTPVVARSLSQYMELPSRETMIKLVESEDFSFGQKLFGREWTKNQNGFGKCASSAATGALEKARYLRGQRNVPLSDDYLYSLVNDGRDRGSTLGENMRAISTRGIARRDLVGHGDIYRRNYNARKADADALRFRAHESFVTPGEQEVCAALISRIPVVIAIHVGRNWRNFDRDGVLIGDHGPGNHSEHLDDIRYSRQRGRFEFRKASSHGTSYGEDGYCWVYYSKHLETVHSSHTKYAVPSAIDDPMGQNPMGDEIIDDEQQDESLDKPKLIIASGEFCDWCKKWNREDRQRVVDAGVEVIPGDVPGELIPRYKLIVGDKERVKVGYWSAHEILSALANLRTTALYKGIK